MDQSLYKKLAGAALLALGSGGTAAQPVGGNLAAQSRAAVRISVSVRPRISLSVQESAAASSGELGYTLVEVADTAPAIDLDSQVSNRTPRAPAPRLLLVVPD